MPPAKVSLIPIDRDGTTPGWTGEVPEAVGDILRATAKLYESVGFVVPWIGYLAITGGCVVGTCAFKSPPAGGRAELAYHTFPQFEGRGYATAMARELIALSVRRDPSLLIAAQTLPAHSASHRILEKLGFRHVTTLDHPEDGQVWEWHKNPCRGC